MWIRVSFITLLGVLWGMVAMLGVPAPLGAGLSVVALSGALVWRARERRRLRAAARQLAQALGSELSLPPTHPQQRFTAVLQALHNSSTMPAPLVQLPLYVALGAPHSGLETFLQHAGVTWLAREVPNIAGCTWSVARECAVLRPRDAASARAGLDALYRHRAQAPVNGFLVALSLEDLLDQPHTALRAQAQQLRQDIDVLQEVLHCRAPVYLVVTKCDRLAGFLDTFTTLPVAARQGLLGKVWDGNEVPPLEWLSSQLDGLVQNLALETLAAMQGTPDVAARDRIYQFPDQLSSMRTPLLTWANAFFASNRRRAMPDLQGMFFVAVAQGGYVYDRLHGTDSIRVPTPITAPTPFFTQSVFTRGMLPDSDRPTAVGTARSPKLARQVGLAAAALLFLLPMVTYVQNSYYLAGSREAVSDIARDLQGSDSHLASLITLERTRQQLEMLDAAAERDSWLNEQSGMGQSATLRDSVRAIYLRTLRDAVLQPMVGYDAQQMLLFAQRHAGDNQVPSEREFKLFFDKLRLHLLLTGAYDAHEHVLDADDVAWLADTLSHRWLRAQGEATDVATQDVLKQHVVLYLQALQQDPQLRLARDVEAIVGTRRVLARADAPTALLMQGTTGAEAYSLNLAQMLGETTSPLYSEEVLSGGYTRDGWENVVRNHLAALPQHNQTWVLGSRVVARLTPYLQGNNATAALEAAYWQRYVGVWQQFLGTIRTAPTRSNEETAALLQKLQTASEPALGRLRETLAYNMAPLQGGHTGVGADVQVMAVQIANLQALRDALNAPRTGNAGHDAQSMNSH